MGKISLKTEDHRDIFLYRTRVENLFINEFLPDAPGDCVKVFIFGLMYAQYDQQIDSKTLALTLGITERDVDNAWKYWESKGLVRITEDDEGGIGGIEFIRQIDQFYGKTEGKAANEEVPAEGDDSADAIIARLINRQLREIFDKYERLTGRTLSPHDTSKFTDAIKVYNIEPDVLDFAIDYCIGIDKSSVDYICKVALRWTEDGARDVAAVKQTLDKRSKRNDAYRKIFAEVGFNRLPNPTDREIMDRWFDELGCSLAEVLDACKAAGGKREPSLRYVDKVIENRILEKGGVNTRLAGKDSAPAGSRKEASSSEGAAKVSRKVLKDYYDHLRSEGDRIYRERIEEVSGKIPGMADIFSGETRLTSQLIALRPGPDAQTTRKALREKRMELDARKRELLTEGGYPEDYLDRKYRCDICRDTGYTDEGKICACARERAEEAYEWIRKKENH